MRPDETSACWTVLGIEPTDDERIILKAYAKCLKACRPDDDPEGFQRLVQAREQAIWIAARLATTPSRNMEWTAPSFQLDNTGEEAAVEYTERPAGIIPADTFLEDAVPISAKEDGESSTDHTLLEKVLKELYALMSGMPGRRESNNKNEGWVALFAMASGLDLEASRNFRDAIAQSLSQILPPVGHGGTDDAAAFERGEGSAALVDLIERECQFNWSGTKLFQLTGSDVAQRYLYWLSQAQIARALIERRSNAAQAYTDPQSGVPILPAEDAAVLLSDRRAKDSYDKAKTKTGWRLSFDVRCFFVPVDILCAYGLNLPAFVLSAFSLLLSILMFSVPRVYFHILFSGMTIYILLRIAVGLFVGRYHLIQLGKWVKDADRLGLLGQTRQSFLASASRLHRLAVLASAVDFLSMILIIAGGLMLLPAAFNQDLLDVPADVVLDELALSLFQKAATDDNFSDQDFAELLTTLANARAEIPRTEPLHEAKLNDGLKFNDLIAVRSRLGPTITDTDRHLTPLAAHVERERKLRRIIADYRDATPERRRQIEGTLVGWSGLLRNGKANTRLSATIWALVPPRATDELPTVHLALEVRRLLVSLFLQSDLIGPTIASDFAEVPAALHDLLNIPDEELLQSISPVDPISVAGARLWISTPPLARAGKDDLSLVIDWPKVTPGTADPPWDETAADWRFFAGIANLCLKSNESATLDALLAEMAALSVKAADMGGSVPSGYWSRAGAQLLSIGDCRSSYMKKVAPNSRFEFGVPQDAYSRFKNALQSNDLVEARRIVDFAKEVSSGGRVRNYDIVRQFNIYMGNRKLQKGDIVDALEYSDADLPWTADCQTRSLRGFILSALGEKERALAELSAALSDGDQKKLCGEQENPPISDFDKIRHEISLLKSGSAK